MQTNRTLHLSLVEPVENWRSVEEITSILARVVMAFAVEVCEVALPTPAQVAAALREPVSLAAVVADVAAALDVAPPPCVLAALDSPAPR